MKTCYFSTEQKDEARFEAWEQFETQAEAEVHASKMSAERAAEYKAEFGEEDEIKWVVTKLEVGPTVSLCSAVACFVRGEKVATPSIPSKNFTADNGYSLASK